MSAIGSYAQIQNSTALQTNANFNIDGTGSARAFYTSDSTISSGRGHYIIRQKGSFRWAIGTFTAENGTEGQGSDFSLFSYNNGGSYRGNYLTILRTNGAVGINTSAATAQLHVNALPTATVAKFTLSNIAETNAALTIANGTSSPGSFITSITGRSYSPGRPFGVILTGESEDIAPPTNELNAAAVVIDGRSKNASRLNTANVLTISSYTIPLVVVKADGSMGIGTLTTGTNKLAVEGTIAARRLKVTQTTPWPDYVFEATYSLPSLQAVEDFINKNKHLPEVPSANEIAEHGQDVGEMNTILLKKVEELTLHLISMQKEIAALKDSNKVLEEKVKKIQR
ncbi:hypothetical protein FHW36_1169 [Chitinophaga polysaccharea]|uniref:Uncharacterized protein n=1 Tax=Chitinophaga polysaccharea TaxID=1293035 RepID=A0A561P2H8_9BACT|nr:hypothetical protein [Chitinophaga polysaccharea]TWF32336.1 hypothetical protein FHW36_1169 [Chitinophaga polysaccharea]